MHKLNSCIPHLTSSSTFLPLPFCKDLFFHLARFSALSSFLYDEEHEPKRWNESRDNLRQKKKKKLTRSRDFNASKNSSLTLFMFSPLEPSSHCCFLFLSLRFHQTADYCHQRKELTDYTRVQEFTAEEGEVGKTFRVSPN